MGASRHTYIVVFVVPNVDVGSTSPDTAEALVYDGSGKPYVTGNRACADAYCKEMQGIWPDTEYKVIQLR